MQSSDSVAAAAAVNIPGERIRLFNPTELARAKAGDFADTTQRTLRTVNTKEAADQLIREGWITFNAVVEYDTETAGLSVLPPASAAEPPTEEVATSLGDMLPPSGHVQHLPKKMPAFYNLGNNRSLVDMVVECYEVKVIDEEAKCARHPICKWPTDAKDRKKAGYEDGANLNNRLAMYYAIKGGTESIEELKARDVKTKDLLKIARDLKAAHGSKKTYFELCKELHVPVA